MTGTHHLVECSTPFGLLSTAAAVDAGLLGSDPAERTLLVSHNTPAPEARQRFEQRPELASLVSRFGRVVDWNATIAPWHPSRWSPSASDAPVVERALRAAWGLEAHDLVLVAESVHVRPSLSLAALFPGARIVCYADGLMAYGPTRDRLPLPVGRRVEALLSMDLLGGVVSRLLHEWEPVRLTLPAERFTRVVQEVAERTSGLPEPTGGSTALVLGQYLGQLGLMSAAEEQREHERMVEAARASGAQRVIFKPHPAAGGGSRAGVLRTAERLGVELEVFDSPVVAEVLLEHLQPDTVISAFSTGLATARSLYGCRTVALGADRFLGALTPVQNSNRVPALVCDLTTESWDPSTGRFTSPSVPADDVPQLQLLIDAVAYCMQPALVPDLRDRAVQAATRRPDLLLRAVPTSRLFHLGLPGGTPSTRALRGLPEPVLARLSRAAMPVARHRDRARGALRSVRLRLAAGS